MNDSRINTSKTSNGKAHRLKGTARSRFRAEKMLLFAARIFSILPDRIMKVDSASTNNHDHSTGHPSYWPRGSRFPQGFVCIELHKTRAAPGLLDRSQRQECLLASTCEIRTELAHLCWLRVLLRTFMSSALDARLRIEQTYSSVKVLLNV